MYSIEEYGKAVILKGFLTENKIKYSIPRWIFGKGRPKSGRTSHEEKLAEG